MKDINKFITLVSCFLLVLNTNLGAAQACVFSQPVLEAKKQHDVVFSAKMIGCYSKENSSFVKFRSINIWKGEVRKFYLSSVPCDTTFFKRGKDYLIYAKYLYEKKYIDISYGLTDCSRTVEIIPLWKAYLLNFISKFDGNPIAVDYRIRDFEELGSPIKIFK